jgi:CheY-like chemotaxis protein
MSIPGELLSNAPRIVVADADEPARRAWIQTLSPFACDILEAVDGRDALVKALVREPSLVITELSLPLVDGYTLCDILRHDRVTERVPILVATAEKRPAEHLRVQQLGADVVLTKPTPGEVMLASVQALLNRSHALRDRADAAQQLAAQQLLRSRELMGRQPLSRQYRRFATETPPLPPPALKCPQCDGPLRYERSHVGGVSARHQEQWDYFTCATHGTFQYRHRTRKLRHFS